MDKKQKTQKGHPNLIVPSSEQARINGAMGGRKTQENLRKRKQLKEELEILLDSEEKQKKICFALIEEAEKGNYKAFETIRDTIGQKPTEKQELLTNNLQININRNATIEQKD
jgi:hypothetical protein